MLLAFFLQIGDTGALCQPFYPRSHSWESLKLGCKSSREAPPSLGIGGLSPATCPPHTHTACGLTPLSLQFTLLSEVSWHQDKGQEVNVFP